MTPIRPCVMPRCPNPARPGKSRCVDHYREYERGRSARRREATKGIFKTKRWAMTRKAVLARDPICKVRPGAEDEAAGLLDDYLTRAEGQGA